MRLNVAIIWDDNLKTGISIIDEQHQDLFALINNLDKFTDIKENFDEALIELQTYVSMHFKTEEEYMQYMGYPGYEYHKFCHDSFIDDYKSILKKVSEVDSITDLGPELAALIQDWQKDHYTTEDIKMATFIKNNSSNKLS